MESLAESVREQPAMPRFEDGSVNLKELMRRIAEDVGRRPSSGRTGRFAAEPASSARSPTGNPR